MLEILEWIISQITTDATLNAIVPVANIYTGPVDIIIDEQNTLSMPMIIVSTISEVQRTVPQGARDTQIQIDLWSRTSQLEVEEMYERIIELLTFRISDQGSAHIFWDRLGGGVDMFESDRRMWHKATTFTFWSIKP